MKQIISAVAVTLTFISYIPYYRDILRGTTRPHLVSWSLWGLLSLLLIVLQLRGGAGYATWVTAAAGMLCGGVILLSFKDASKVITNHDLLVAALSLIAIGFWWFVDQPVISMIFVILADGLAFIPTVRKSWHNPHSETMSLYAINTVRFFLVLIAVENYTFLSSVWPLFWLWMNALFVCMLYLRRKRLSVVA